MNTETAITTWDAGRESFYRKLGEFVQYFQIAVRHNADGVPLELIDPGIMAQTMTQVDSFDEVPDAQVLQARTRVEFSEGFPTIDGVPLWERLDGERVDFYQLFKTYRELRYTEGSRSVARVAAMHDMEPRHVNLLSKAYHWQLRVRAFDHNRAMTRKMMRLNAIEELDDRHGHFANKMLAMSMDYLEKHPEQLNPKVAIQLAELGFKKERLALGLQQDKPGAEIASQRGAQITIENHSNVGSNNTQTNQVGIIEKMDEKAKDVTHLESVLHVLEESGAFTAEAEAKKQEALEAEETRRLLAGEQVVEEADVQKELEAAVLTDSASASDPDEVDLMSRAIEDARRIFADVKASRGE